MHLQSLNLLQPKVKEEMLLKENVFRDLGIKVIQTVTLDPLHYVTYAPAKFEHALSNGV